LKPQVQTCPVVDSAMLVPIPANTLRIRILAGRFTGSGTRDMRRGMAEPSSPPEPSPQASSRPADVSASVCPEPQEMAVTRMSAGSFTGTGAWSSNSVVPLPSCPCSLMPQAQTRPVADSAML
jgi:hypothetical protein